MRLCADISCKELLRYIPKQLSKSLKRQCRSACQPWDLRRNLRRGIGFDQTSCFSRAYLPANECSYHTPMAERPLATQSKPLETLMKDQSIGLHCFNKNMLWKIIWSKCIVFTIATQVIQRYSKTASLKRAWDLTCRRLWGIWLLQNGSKWHCQTSSFWEVNGIERLNLRFPINQLVTNFEIIPTLNLSGFPCEKM